MCSIQAKGANVILQLTHLYAFCKFSYMYCRDRCVLRFLAMVTTVLSIGLGLGLWLSRSKCPECILQSILQVYDYETSGVYSSEHSMIYHIYWSAQLRLLWLLLNVCTFHSRSSKERSNASLIYRGEFTLEQGREHTMTTKHKSQHTQRPNILSSRGLVTQ